MAERPVSPGELSARRGESFKLSIDSTSKKVIGDEILRAFLLWKNDKLIKDWPPFL